MKKIYITAKREKKIGHKKFQTEYMLFPVMGKGKFFKSLKLLVDSINFTDLDRISFDGTSCKWVNYNELIVIQHRGGKLSYIIENDLSDEEKKEFIVLLPEKANSL